MTDDATKPKHAFFITPIGEDGSDERVRSDLVLDYILKPALVPDLVSDIARADRSTDPGDITPHIVTRIMDADLVIADLTGANPNVYYELAIAHAFARPTIHIIYRSERPRFDIKDVRAFSYGTVVNEAAAAQDIIRKAAESALATGSSPTLVSRAAELRQIATSDDPTARQLSEIRQLLSELIGEAMAGPAIDSVAARSVLSVSPLEPQTQAVVEYMMGRFDREDLLQWMEKFFDYLQALPSSSDMDRKSVIMASDVLARASSLKSTRSFLSPALSFFVNVYIRLERHSPLPVALRPPVPLGMLPSD